MIEGINAITLGTHFCLLYRGEVLQPLLRRTVPVLIFRNELIPLSDAADPQSHHS